MGLDTVAPQPPPHLGRESVNDAVIADLNKRREGGIRKYGMELETHNGRSFLIDSYQEVLDSALYLRGAIMEEEDREAAVHEMREVQRKLQLLLSQVKDKWFLGEILMNAERAITRLSPRPRPEPGPSSPSAS
jgi:hypothetical protein